MSIFDELIATYSDQKQLIDCMSNDLTPFIAEAIALLSETLITGQKIITLGSNDLQAIAEHTTYRLVHPTGFERPSLPSFHLAYTHNLFTESSPETIAWVQQLSALAVSNDCLLVFAGQNNHPEIRAVIEYAQANDIHIVCICDGRHQELSESISSDQVCIQLGSTADASFHFLIVDSLVKLIEKQLFGA